MCVGTLMVMIDTILCIQHFHVADWIPIEKKILLRRQKGEARRDMGAAAVDSLDCFLQSERTTDVAVNQGYGTVVLITTIHYPHSISKYNARIDRENDSLYVANYKYNIVLYFQKLKCLQFTRIYCLRGTLFWKKSIKIDHAYVLIELFPKR
ncbi:hypothetical protein ACJX0J_016602 [Zea mays]